MGFGLTLQFTFPQEFITNFDIRNRLLNTSRPLPCCPIILAKILVRKVEVWKNGGAVPLKPQSC